MARKGKLFAALDRHKGRDIRLEKQRAQQKAAAKRRAHETFQAEKPTEANEEAEWEDDSDDDGGVALTEQNEGAKNTSTVSLRDQLLGIIANPDEVSSGEELDENELVESSLSGSELSSNVEDEQDEGIPLSDLDSAASSDKADMVPYHRLTINNTTALTKAHRAIATTASAPFAAYQTVTSLEPVEIKDVHDDLSRELAFYKQSLDAAVEGRRLLKKADVPFSRPTDFFAEMVKSDEHMGKIRAKMVEKESDKKAAAEARKLRELKKFGKQVQVAKQQERDKAKRQTLDKINQLKRKHNASSGDTREEDLFDVALEDTSKPVKKRTVSDRRAAPLPNAKRQRKNERFGFGGKKKYKKSGDADSSADLTGFSPKRMKSRTGSVGGKAKRLGKSRRTKVS